MYIGDTAPAALFQVTDETFNETIGTVLNLSTATALQTKFIGATHSFNGGVTTAIWPATADPDGIHFWNCQYAFAASDLTTADVYQIFVIVTLSAGPPAQVETFALTDTLTVEALP